MENRTYAAGKIHDNLVWLTRTAILIALLIVSQAATAPLGSTLITGSVVNALLAVSLLTCGMASGLCVALISPVIARLFGIGPLWALIPFIAAGNAVFVSIWWIFTAKARLRPSGPAAALTAAALVSAASVKFLVLYIGVSKLAVPVILKLPEKQAAVISGMFALPQLITALIGGFIAVMVYSAARAALRSR